MASTRPRFLSLLLTTTHGAWSVSVCWKQVDPVLDQQALNARDLLHEPLDGATLAGRVAALEQDDQPLTGRLDPLLELQQLDLQQALGPLVSPRAASARDRDSAPAR